MPIPKNKEELIQAIESSYSKLQLDLIDISNEQALEVELPGHAKDTLMSVENLVAYLIGWGDLVLKWNKKIEKKQTVTFPDDGFTWVQLGDLAQKFYIDYKDFNFSKLRTKLDKTVQKILKLIHSKTNEELYHTTWYKNYSMGRMIQLNTSSPYKNARSRIRKWKKSTS